MKEQAEYSPKHKSQFEIINEYKNRLEALSPDKKIRIKPITYTEGEEVIRGFRIILNEHKTAKKGLITDWDDTLETYSNRKPKYFLSLFQSVNEKSGIQQDNFFTICNAINKSARVLNWQQTHPENYSPFLEMITESQLLEDIAESSQDEFFLNLRNSPSEETARIYILNNIIPKFGGAVEPETKNNKTYFKESKHQSVAYILEEKHDFINQDVWASFNETMTCPNLTNEDIENFDLDDNVYWAISSFGALEFQLKKIIGSLELLAKNDKRMPNEILIVTHGRKRKALLEIRDEQPSVDWTYADDSERQLEKMENDKIKLLNAKRDGAKRISEKSKFNTVSMNRPLSELLG